MKLSILIAIFVAIMPWKIKRWIYCSFYNYDIDKTARIGFSVILVKKLMIKAGARIGSMNMVKGLDNLELHEFSSIGNLNWITGFPSGTESKHFSHIINRVPELVVFQHSAITNRHLIDCTSSVIIGEFSTFAGFRSQILTHSIDLKSCRQNSQPVLIGNYTFIGTASTILPGSVLPDYSVLGANSLLNKEHSEKYCLYAGVPAVKLIKFDEKLGYFNRKIGHVE